jgi:putative transcriptional regulator
MDMLHYCYIVFMLRSVSRRPKTELDLVLNRVEQFRGRAGLSRQELAERVGVHYQTIGYIERGEYSPSLVLALKIASTVNATVEDIFWLEGSPNE